MDKFIIEGILDFRCQEGGYANDAWDILGQHEPLEDLVARHFGAEYDKNADRLIGPVRITIERLEEDHGS